MLDFDPVKLGDDAHKVDLYVVEVGGKWALVAYNPVTKRTWSINYNEEFLGAFSMARPVWLREVRSGAQGTVEFRDKEGAVWTPTEARVPAAAGSSEDVVKSS